MDTAANAARNGLAASSPPGEATQRLADAEEKLRAHGGRVTDNVDDPGLTHSIIDDDDSGRYVALMRRTARPRLKHIVLPSWVEESLDEDTLMDEDCEFRRGGADAQRISRSRRVYCGLDLCMEVAWAGW